MVIPNAFHRTVGLLLCLPFAGSASAESRPSGPPASEFVRTECPGSSIITTVEGQGRSVVLLPSRGRGTLDDFDAVARHLANEGYRVLRPQPRNTAGSTGVTPRTLFDLASDVACVISKVGGGSAVVVGHAYGNWVARAVAARYPERTEGVVLAAAAARDIPPELITDLDRIVNEDLPETERLHLIGKTFFAAGNDPGIWLDGWYRDAAAEQKTAADATPRDQWWAAVTAPLLDLQAEEDPWRPRESRDELAAELGSRVSVRTIRGASHALFPEQPVEAAKQIAAWISGLPR